MEQQREREQHQHQHQQHHMLAPADVGHHETLPPLNLLPLPQPPTTAAQQSQRQQHGTDPGPPPPFPRLHPNPNPVASPPSYSHSALPLRFPDVPTTELPPPRPRSMAHNDGGDQALPSLMTLTGVPPLRNDPTRQQQQQQQHWPVLNPIKSYPVHSTQNQLPKIDSADVMELDASSNSVGSVASLDHTHDARASSVSLDDPDVRLAAEALGDLRADFVSSPPSTLMAGSPTAPAHRQSKQPEPLLSLLTTSHPLLATTIGSATSAYGGAKNFSPRFKSSAEYVEGYLTPIANTVGSVGRVTGVEGGVRWFLGAGRRNNSSDLEAGGGSKKRRKVERHATGSLPVALHNGSVEGVSAQSPDIMETVILQDSLPPTPRGDRRLSMASTDTLPAYDEMRSPAYTESHSQKPPREGAPWQSRLIMSTSGLSIAMSEESLRSLKYCLSWLRWANTHIATVIAALKETLDEYDAANPELQAQEPGSEKQEGQSASPQVSTQSRSQLAARIDTLKGDVVKTLQGVVNTVSKYAGGALPENARVLVRRHLTSIPQRFRLATMTESGPESNDKDSESAIRDGAHKILVLAKEGLDVVTQVSGVVDGTIVSAEDWCEKMGKKRRAGRQAPGELLLPQMETKTDMKGDANTDVKMG